MMSLQDLIDKFADISRLPIEIDEIVAQITHMGYQDEIYLCPDDTNPKEIRGAFYQFTRHDAVYGDPVFVTHIMYSRNVPIDWQRLIVAKELVHIFDSRSSRTGNDQQVDQLIDTLVGPFSSDTYGLADLQATKDRLAVYQALPLLFPRAALAEARSVVNDDSRMIGEIAKWVCIPVEFVAVMLSDGWDQFNGALEIVDQIES